MMTREYGAFFHRTILLVFLVLITAASGCTVKSPAVPGGVVPECRVPTAGEWAFGQKCLNELNEDYDTGNSHPKYLQLVTAFDHLLEVIEANHAEWQLYLFDNAEIVDVRAVQGNHIFVWTGFLDMVESEDEIAAILASEIAHILANHTKPVEFTVPTRVLFGAAEIATSLGIMFLSQGAVAISGQGWMQYIYAEASDLDPLDRQYNEEQEHDAMAVACLILERSKYSPQAILTFWKRIQEMEEEPPVQSMVEVDSDVLEARGEPFAPIEVEEDPAVAEGEEDPPVQRRKMRLDRSISLDKRIALLEEVLPDAKVKQEVANEKAQETLDTPQFARP
jgi:predicted Zn-dependent protease